MQTPIPRTPIQKIIDSTDKVGSKIDVDYQLGILKDMVSNLWDLSNDEQKKNFLETSVGFLELVKVTDDPTFASTMINEALNQSSPTAIKSPRPRM